MLVQVPPCRVEKGVAKGDGQSCVCIGKPLQARLSRDDPSAGPISPSFSALLQLPHRIEVSGMNSLETVLIFSAAADGVSSEAPSELTEAANSQVRDRKTAQISQPLTPCLRPEGGLG